MDEQLVPIGRFATATRLSVKALRHYDAIGLLAPAVVDPASGYRYYRLGQANRAEAIRVLRGVDMPLEEIGELLAAVDEAPETVHELLDAHHRRLAAELDRHRRMLDFLQRLLTEKESLMPYDIHVETVPARTVASVRDHARLASISSALESGFGRVFGALAAQGHDPVGPPLVVYHEMAGDEAADVDVEIAIPCPSDAHAADGVQVRELGSGAAAVTTHHGPYDQLAPAYHALTSWIAEHGHEAAGPPREIYVSDPGETPADELETRIEWPIR